MQPIIQQYLYDVASVDSLQPDADDGKIQTGEENNTEVRSSVLLAGQRLGILAQ